MKNLYIVRGICGAGKSTLAKQLLSLRDSVHYEADMYHMDAEGNYNWKAENLGKAHSWCQKMVSEAMDKLHGNIIVSNTFTTPREFNYYLRLAEEKGYVAHVLVKENRHDGKNVHNVPEDVVTAMKNRFDIKL